jgi:plastocyanin|tara:strand:- start:290 stop:1567 length:1278 start_codon:yes stop_codon:yes gene_type:complete
MKKQILTLISLLFFLFSYSQNSINVGGQMNIFSPPSITVYIGDTVIWNNTGGFHNVNATLATYPNNPEGFGNSGGSFLWTFQWVFTIPGVYNYQCDTHIGMGMTGVVIVIFPPGCTDLLACNYDSLATIDDSSCVYIAIAPYYEDFGNGILPAGICGWSQWETQGDGWRFDSVPGYAAMHNGRITGTYAWIDFSGTDVDVVLELEDIDVSNLSSPTLLFDFYSYLDTFNGPINILNVETWDGISWVNQYTYQVNISGWHTYNLDLSNATYSANIVKIRFRGESGGSGSDYFNDLLLDYVKIGNTGCTDPLACNYDYLATMDDSSCNFYFTILYDTVIVNNSYNWHNTILSVSGDYIDTLVNSVGCDSIVNLNLTVTNITGVLDIANKSTLVKITDMLGQKTPYRKNIPLFYIYDDGTVEKKIIIE